jgi:apolipoprotein N-acyltransferase
VGTHFFRKQAGNAVGQDWLVLASGAAVLLFANGRWVVPVATWIYVVCMLRFTRHQPVLRGFVLLASTSAVIYTIAWWGTTSARMTPLQLVPAGLAVLLAFVFLIDRVVASRLAGWWSTLVFPAAYVLFEWLIGLFSPIGSIGMLGYTQYDNLPLIQLASLTGVSGLTFVIAWFGSLVNFAWEQEFAWLSIRKAVLIYSAVICLILVYGGARLAFASNPPGTVRVVGMNLYGRKDVAQMDQALAAHPADFNTLSAPIQQQALNATLREAAAGAQVILWHEGAIDIHEDPSAFLTQAAEAAHRAKIYLVIPLYITYPDSHQMDVNKLVIMDPSGNIVLDHIKFGSANLEDIQPGDGRLKTITTPFGTLSAVICRDLDFPAAIRQAGRNGTDILLAPSFDWYEIDPFHTRYAIFRSIENGVSLVRQAADGYSAATDPYGRVIAAMDYFSSSRQVLLAQVPAHHVATLYAALGEWFDILNAAGLAILILLPGRHARNDTANSLA